MKNSKQLSENRLRELAGIPVKEASDEVISASKNALKDGIYICDEKPKLIGKSLDTLKAVDGTDVKLFVTHPDSGTPIFWMTRGEVKNITPRAFMSYVFIESREDDDDETVGDKKRMIDELRKKHGETVANKVKSFFGIFPDYGRADSEPMDGKFLFVLASEHDYWR